jgi:hypothetical protein
VRRKNRPVRAGKAVVMAGGGEHGVDVVAAASSEIVGGYIAGHTVFGLEVTDHWLEAARRFIARWVRR